MTVATVRATGYRSNVSEVQRRFDAKAKSAVYNAARDGARKTRALARPPGIARAVATYPPEEIAGIISCRVVVPFGQFTAVMFDKGTLGKRKVPLDQGAARRRSSWPVRRRTTRSREGVARSSATRTSSYTAHRHPEALVSGGIPAQYFFIRGKRHAEQQIPVRLRQAD